MLLTSLVDEGCAFLMWTCTGLSFVEGMRVKFGLDIGIGFDVGDDDGIVFQAKA